VTGLQTLRRTESVALLRAVDAMQAGAYVALRGARVDMFRSSMRLVVDQRGSVEPAPKDASFQPKVRSAPGLHRSTRRRPTSLRNACHGAWELHRLALAAAPAGV